MKRVALILLVAGIVGFLILLATRTNVPPERALAPEPRAESVETPPAPEAPPALAPSNERTVVAPLDDGAPLGLEVAGWRVCVVDAATHAAVPGATVSVIDTTAIFSELAALGVGFDTREGLRLRRERAALLTTGPDGCAHFRAPPENAMVEARSGAHWAIALVNQVPADRCVTLELALDRALAVRVVDAAGAPVGGVPVAVRRQSASRTDFKWTDTDARDGLATFLHFQRRLAQGGGWHALLAFPVRDQRVVPVDEDTPIDPPVTLVLQDTGRVRVRVRATDGGLPDLERIELHLDAFLDASGTTRIWADGPWAKPRLDAQGEALVPWIGLGLHVEAALVRDAEDRLVARRCAGPTQPGEEVLCELTWSPSSLRTVTGRFVLQDGRAWPAARVSAFAVLFPTPSSYVPTRELEVASDGRFRMPVHEARPADGTRAFRFAAAHPEDPRLEVVAVVPLDQDVPPEGLDLGDVVLDCGALLLSGRVVDPARRPISGASLWLGARTTVSGREFWPRVASSGASTTGADGAFALYLQAGDAPPSEPLRLTTRAPGFVPERERDVRFGERNVEVVLNQAGQLAGSLELDRGLAPADVFVFLVSALQPTERRGTNVKSDATFEYDGLPPGVYSLDVRRRGASGQFEREPAARVDDLLVVAGETCRDPRIQGLRIESVLATLRIRVLDQASSPLQGAAISIVGRPDVRAALSDAAGVCRVRCDSLPVDLEVSAFGYARQFLASVSTDRDVVLDLGLRVRLHSSARPSGGAPKYALGVTLYTLDANGAREGPAWGPEYVADYSTERTFFDERGDLALRLPAPGVYECDVSVTVLAGGVGRGAPVELAPKPRITVLPSATEQRFELEIPEEAVRAAVERALQ